MAPGAIVFALANPDPEVDPDEAREYAAVVATGRSDYPNQINNVLAFPGVFRGLLDAQSTTITDAMLVAAARALADVVPAEELGPDYIIPSVFHPDVASGVAAAVRDAVAAEAGRRSCRQRLRTAVARGARSLSNLQHDGYMDHMGSDPKAGRLLVATPLLGDPNFRRTVVLIVEHEDVQGTLGVVLNRPTAIGVGPGARAVDRARHRALGGVPRRPGGAEQRPRARDDPRQGRADRLAGRSTAPRRWPGSACSTWTRRPGCSPRPSPACVSTRATPAGPPDSSRRRSTRAPGTCSPPSRAMSSPPTPTASGARCSAVRRATWRSLPPTLTTQLSIDPGDGDALLADLRAAQPLAS